MNSPPLRATDRFTQDAPREIHRVRCTLSEKENNVQEIQVEYNIDHSPREQIQQLLVHRLTSRHDEVMRVDTHRPYDSNLTASFQVLSLLENKYSQFQKRIFIDIKRTKHIE